MALEVKVINDKPNYLHLAFARPTQLNAAVTTDFVGAVLSRLRGGQSLLLDCRNLEYLDSSGIGALIRLRKQLLERGGKLKLVGVNQEVYDVLKISRLHRLFDIVESVEAAVADFETAKQRKSPPRSYHVSVKKQTLGRARVIVLLQPDALLEVNFQEFLRAIAPDISAFDALLLDLSVVSNMDSFGVAALLQLHSLAQKAGKPFLLISSKPTLGNLLRMHHVEKRFRLFRTINEAVKALKTVQRPTDQISSPAHVTRATCDDDFVDIQFLS